MLNLMNINQYMYNVYDEYMDRYYKNSLQYSKNKGLILRYFKILVDESYNFDSETSIQTDYKNYKYAIYDFTPVLDSQPPSSQAYFDPNIQGTSYNTTMSLTIAGIKNPLPGDMFHFYDLTGNETIDNTEIFRIKNINYIRSINPKYPIYQLDSEYAPIKRKTLDEISKTNVIQHYYWDNETSQFIDSSVYTYYLFLNKNRDNYLNDIYNLYNATEASYNYCKLNSIFKIIQSKLNFSTKIIQSDFMDFNLLDFIGKFSYYYKLKDIDPIINERLFPQIDNDFDPVLSKKLLDLDNEHQDNDIIFSDIKCSTLKEIIQKQDDQTKEEIILKINKNNEKFNIENDILFGDNFNYYNEIYKILFSYYMLNPRNFWKNTIITHSIQNDIKINKDGIFYNINGEYKDYTEYLKNINYDPGYVLSYQGGVQYFTPGSTLGY